MTSRTLGPMLAVCLAAAACGNYSNEDLEFMAAVPTSNQLAVELPSAVNPTAEAELAKRTHDAIATVNGALRNVLGLVDGVRAYTPTSRTGDSRTWGPFPDDNHPGWSWELIVRRDPTTPTTFTYDLQTQNAAAQTGWLLFVHGSFDGAGGAQQGSGQVQANFKLLSDAQFPMGNDTANLADLRITYQNFDLAGSPTEVTMSIDSLPDSSGATTSLNIVYEILADQSGEMVFTLTGNLVAGPATEVVQVTSQWLPTGAGEATMVVASGDGAGLQQIECWDRTFAATYEHKPWSPADDLGTADACPALPSLAPLAP